MKYFLSLIFLALIHCSTAKKPAENSPPPPPPPVASEKAPMKGPTDGNDQTAACNNDGDKRSLEVTTKEMGCELIYTKGKTAAVVSSSSQGTAHCEKSLKKIRTKLEKAGFDCK